MDLITYQVEGMEELVRKARELGTNGQKVVREFLDKAAHSVEIKAKDIVTHDTGLLRSSITPLVDSSPMPVWAKIGPSKAYGLYVELGTRPHWPPIAPLVDWARRHHMSPYAVAAAIAKRGTKPQPFMTPALEKSKGDIDKFLVEAGNKLQRDWEL